LRFESTTGRGAGALWLRVLKRRKCRPVTTAPRRPRTVTGDEGPRRRMLIVDDEATNPRAARTSSSRSLRHRRGGGRSPRASTPWPRRRRDGCCRPGCRLLGGSTHVARLRDMPSARDDAARRGLGRASSAFSTERSPGRGMRRLHREARQEIEMIDTLARLLRLTGLVARKSQNSSNRPPVRRSGAEPAPDRGNQALARLASAAT